MAGRSRSVGLEWVVWDGRDAHVSEFAQYRDGPRPEVTCPECGEPLTLRLGDVRTWHAGHKPGATCTLSDGESALHHNTKMALAKQLRTTDRLVIEEPCVGAEGGLVAEDCAGTRVRAWVSGWTSVAVEQRLHTRRPDVTLLDGDTVVGAIEVWVSHRVEPEKQALYEDWSVDWVEVDATPALIEGDGAWHPPDALPVVRGGPGEPHRCEACLAHAARVRQQLADEEALRQARDAERCRAQAAWAEDQAEREAARDRARAEEKEARKAFTSGVFSLLERSRSDGVAIERVRVFDRLEPDGTAHRDALVIADVHRDGEKLGAFLGVLSDGTVLARVKAQDGHAGYHRLGATADTYLQRLREGGTKVDPQEGWFRLLSVLGEPQFVRSWTWEGKDHRWPADAAASAPPWRVSWAKADVDGLDLLRYFFVRYLSGLPVRYLWSRKTGAWFQPAVLREEPWRLWPAPLGKVEQVAQTWKRRR